MSKFRPIFMNSLYMAVALVLLQTHFSFCNGISILDLNLVKQSEMDVTMKRVFSERDGDCLAEAEMDSETNRRVLVMQRKYISYETLKRDMVPCETPGASYYNCHGRQANAYRRGCEVITGCARHISDIQT